MSIAQSGLGKLLILVGIVAIAVAFFLAPWVATNVLGQNLGQERGADLGLYGVPIIAGLALIAGVVGTLIGNWRKLAGIAAIIFGLAGIGYVLMNSNFRSMLGGLVDVRPGAAYWICIAGFVVVIVGGLFEFAAAQSDY